MKRQGTYGFTFDSKAEEWAAWAMSCLEHNAPETWKGRRDLARFANDMLDIHDGIAQNARHSPAQQQNGCEIGEGSGRPCNRVLWPLAAAGAVCVTVALVLASQAGWL